MEILSPAGSYSSVLAAVLNGANAVYLGQQKFSARQNAENFDYDTLKNAIEFCHIRGVKVYQAINTIVFDNEFDDLQETMRVACKLGVDAFIIQDLGVLELAKLACPDMHVHASTQMTVHTVMGAKLLKELGFSRVVLARELSLEEIEEIVHAVDIEVEVFSHGALCMSVSGQCYMSAMIGTRSGNKGSCAGTCRMPFTAVNDKDEHALSLKDLCTTHLYKQLEKAGVTSLKIEGRMKRPEYVAAATKAYSELSFGITPNVEQLKAVFSRSGFTDGYLVGKVHGNMFGTRSRDDVIAADAGVLAEIRETYHLQKAIYPIKMQFFLKENEPARLQVSADNGDVITIFGDIPVKAINKPTTAQIAKESLAKLGGTAYFLSEFETQIDDTLILPKSKLNELRRTAVEKLNAKRCSNREVSFNKVELQKSQVRHRTGEMKLCARFGSYSQIVRAESLEYIILPIGEVLKYADRLLPFKEKIVLEPDRIMFSTENDTIKALSKLYKLGFTRLAASNLAHIKLGSELGFELFATAFLNITNSISAQCYTDLGVKHIVFSSEGTLSALNAIKLTNDVECGILGYGYFPLMITRNCPIKRTIPCAKCGGRSELTDRLGSKFRVICNEKRYSEVLNSKRIVLSDKLADLKSMDFTELYFTTETKGECEKVINFYINEEKAQGDFTRGLYYRGII